MIDALRRAAKHNPAWRDARIYAPALTDGVQVYTDGTLNFDLAEITYGFRDYKAEDGFLVSEVYQGSTVVCVISDNQPDLSHVIKLDGTFYHLSSVKGSDAFCATVSYIASALEDAPTIRTDAL